MSLPLHNGDLAVLEMQFPGKDNARRVGLCVCGVGGGGGKRGWPSSVCCTLMFK